LILCAASVKPLGLVRDGPFSSNANCAKLALVESLRFHNRPVLRRPALVLAFSGWNDAGQSATAAVRFVTEQLGATRFASLDPEEFFDFTVLRPHVRLVEGAQRAVEWVTLDFHAAVVSVLPRDYVFGWGPEPHLRWRTFNGLILQLARECGAELVVTLGGYLAEVLYTRPVPVTGFASDAELLRRVDVGATRYEGPTGIVGVLADACRSVGIASVSLWAALPHYIAAAPNPRGTLALLLRLTQLLDLPVDLTPLQAEAAEFEQRVNEAVAADPQLSAYVRELKKRESSN
jgi:proteasome assembly chaperone (PAC2) family protein